MFKLVYKDTPTEISKDIENENFTADVDSALKDFTFYEFTLEELGLPNASELLDNLTQIRKQVGIAYWKTSRSFTSTYYGFSLTYNPDFYKPEVSIYHQTFGSNMINQSFSRNSEEDALVNGKNTYYDTYGFRKVPPIVDNHLGYFFKKFSMPLLRSRAAYSSQQKVTPMETSFHKDELPFNMLRINIPLQTREEHVLSIVGEDEYGNNYEMLNKHLEVGKAYIWNTRIPHGVHLTKDINESFERIHLVLGFSPWIDYNPEEDSFTKSKLWGKDLKSIVTNKLFIKQ